MDKGGCISFQYLGAFWKRGKWNSGGDDEGIEYILHADHFFSDPILCFSL